MWLSDGWEWKNNNKVNAPDYWFLKEGEWWTYYLDGAKAVNPNDTLMHVSFYEAEAYARWKNKRLLTEQEWEVAASIHGKMEGSNFLGQASSNKQNNQLFGTAWEWTNSSYLPYPYYKKQDGALGEYNGKFMVDQMILRGGSCATPKDHYRLTYRNFFQPNLRWQFTGIRLGEHC